MLFPAFVIPEWVHSGKSPSARRRLTAVRRIVLCVRLVGWLILLSALVSAAWAVSRPSEVGFVNLDSLVVTSLWLGLVAAVLQTLREAAGWVLGRAVQRSLRQFVDGGSILKVTPEISRLYRAYIENDGRRDERLLFQLQQDYNKYLRDQQVKLGLVFS